MWVSDPIVCKAQACVAFARARAGRASGISGLIGSAGRVGEFIFRQVREDVQSRLPCARMQECRRELCVRASKSAACVRAKSECAVQLRARKLCKCALELNELCAHGRAVAGEQALQMNARGRAFAIRARARK